MIWRRGLITDAHYEGKDGEKPFLDIFFKKWEPVTVVGELLMGIISNKYVKTDLPFPSYLMGRDVYFVSDKTGYLVNIIDAKQWMGPEIPLDSEQALPNNSENIDPKEILDSISEMNEDAMYPTGFETAIVGTVERFGMPPQILLDYDKCISILIENDKMTEEEAIEFFEYNILGASFGNDSNPCFVKYPNR